jgi:hypothetical protein
VIQPRSAPISLVCHRPWAAAVVNRQGAGAARGGHWPRSPCRPLGGSQRGGSQGGGVFAQREEKGGPPLKLRAPSPLCEGSERSEGRPPWGRPNSLQTARDAARTSAIVVMGWFSLLEMVGTVGVPGVIGVKSGKWAAAPVSLFHRVCCVLLLSSDPNSPGSLIGTLGVLIRWFLMGLIWFLIS